VVVVFPVPHAIAETDELEEIIGKLAKPVDVPPLAPAVVTVVEAPPPPVGLIPG
jgi:hypothetical protein